MQFVPAAAAQLASFGPKLRLSVIFSLMHATQIIRNPSVILILFCESRQITISHRIPLYLQTMRYFMSVAYRVEMKSGKCLAPSRLKR